MSRSHAGLVALLVFVLLVPWVSAAEDDDDDNAGTAQATEFDDDNIFQTANRVVAGDKSVLNGLHWLQAERQLFSSIHHGRDVLWTERRRNVANCHFRSFPYPMGLAVRS